jgi:hypothetical protein
MLVNIMSSDRRSIRFEIMTEDKILDPTIDHTLLGVFEPAEFWELIFSLFIC